MKIKQMVLLAIILLAIPAHASASLVYQEIVSLDGPNDVFDFSFEADVNAPAYRLTVTDLSEPPQTVADNPRTAWADSPGPGHALFGFGSVLFTPKVGATYEGFVLADGAGTEAGLGTLELRVDAVPIPPSLFLLGSGLIFIMGLGKKVVRNSKLP